jgi:hypothetical protein
MWAESTNTDASGKSEQEDSQKDFQKNRRQGVTLWEVRELTGSQILQGLGGHGKNIGFCLHLPEFSLCFLVVVSKFKIFPPFGVDFFVHC